MRLIKGYSQALFPFGFNKPSGRPCIIQIQQQVGDFTVRWLPDNRIGFSESSNYELESLFNIISNKIVWDWSVFAPYQRRIKSNAHFLFDIYIMYKYPPEPYFAILTIKLPIFQFFSLFR